MSWIDINAVNSSGVNTAITVIKESIAVLFSATFPNTTRSTDIINGINSIFTYIITVLIAVLLYP
ncbi:MAG: hypothetical protein LHW51_10975 [Candidatus Cloacimonetes bacterium]|nr:hypothetical protein [Candidatus Cloacimonadota bacterium]